MLQLGLEVGGGVGQPEGLQLGGLAMRVLAQQHEVAGVGDQRQPVAFPVAAHLGGVGGWPGVIGGRFDLHHAALRRLALLGPPGLHLPGGIEAEVGMPRPLLRQLADAIYTLGRSEAPTAFSKLFSGG